MTEQKQIPCMGLMLIFRLYPTGSASSPPGLLHNSAKKRSPRRTQSASSSAAYPKPSHGIGISPTSFGTRKVTDAELRLKPALAHGPRWTANCRGRQIKRPSQIGY